MLNIRSKILVCDYLVQGADFWGSYVVRSLIWVHFYFQAGFHKSFLPAVLYGWPHMDHCPNDRQKTCCVWLISDVGTVYIRSPEVRTLHQITAHQYFGPDIEH